MDLGEKKSWEKNPRKADSAKIATLKKTILKFGDLGGFVFNVRNERLVGGHMRKEVMLDGKIEIAKRFDPPTSVGTVAIGHVVASDGERFFYREVDWDDNLHAAAAIAANKSAGDWDVVGLKETLAGLETIGFDMQLTGFDFSELGGLLGGATPSSAMDYSVLDGESVDGKIIEMQEGVRRAIMIEFEPDDYTEAFEIVKMFRAKNAYLGGAILEFLREAKSNL